MPAARKPKNPTGPIDAALRVTSTPQQVFRMLTSQNELRRWWAPRVIMSRNQVCQEDDRLVEMKLMQADKNRLVRYSWRGVDWPPEAPPTTITFQINDLGASRRQTGEGLMLEITHDGWSDAGERDRMERIWKNALPTLESLLQGKDVRPWWEADSARGSFKLVRLTSLKSFVEKIEPDNRDRMDRRTISNMIWKVCIGLDGLGSWYLKDNEKEFELRYAGRKVFGVSMFGALTLHWKELEKLVTVELPDFAQRLAAEQDIDVHPEKSADKVPASALKPELWIHWVQDLVRSAREKG
ncbi:MAG: SRPBCC domain-containing protein [Leptospirales bacterium]|nr:SRPBCC domain-containing protein [Leptospirales bacterium]